MTGTAVDGSGNNATCTVPVTVVDNEHPSMTAVVASIASLWPPNHRMVDITLDYGASDNCGSATCAVSVASDEPGDAEWEIVDTHHVRLRAEREGSGLGRTYTISVTCTDAAGNTTVKSVAVLVPHNR